MDKEYFRNRRWLAGKIGADRIVTEYVMHIDLLDERINQITKVLDNTKKAVPKSFGTAFLLLNYC